MGQIKPLTDGLWLPGVWVGSSIKVANGGTILPSSVVPKGKLSLLAKEARVQSEVMKGTLCLNPILFPLNGFIFGGLE